MKIRSPQAAGVRTDSPFGAAPLGHCGAHNVSRNGENEPRCAGPQRSAGSRPRPLHPHPSLGFVQNQIKLN